MRAHVAGEQERGTEQRGDGGERLQHADLVPQEADQGWTGEEGAVAHRRHDADPRRCHRGVVGGGTHPDREPERAPRPHSSEPTNPIGVLPPTTSRTTPTTPSSASARTTTTRP